MSEEPISPSQVEELLLRYLREVARGSEAGSLGDWLDRQPEVRRAPHLADQVSLLEQQRSQESAFGARARAQSVPPATNGRLLAGQRIGDFTLVRFIDRGGQGEVWEAEQAGVERHVALKLVLPERIHERTLELFAREARAGGRLAHPCIVRTLAHGRHGELTWIAQELVEGSWTLKDSLAELREGGELPRDYYRQVASFVALLADAVESAHRAGVLHRDIKPQNVLIAPDDTPRLTDFGLARITDESAISLTGDFAGTPFYMSPEQVAARRMGLDHRTDVFSLGVVLYEMLTLQRPFDGDTSHQIFEKILTWEPTDPTRLRSQCPRELATICLKALEKARGARYATMADLAADLRRHLANEPILARPPSPLRRGVKWVQRHPAVSATLAVTLTATAAVSLLALWALRNQAETERQRSRIVALASSRERDRLDDLVAAAQELWPAHPELVPRLEDWIDRARALRPELEGVPGGYPGHRNALADLRASVAAGELDDVPDVESWIEELDSYVQALEGFLEPETGLAGEGRHEAGNQWAVGKRLSIARELEQAFAPGGEIDSLWQEALERIPHEEPYRGTFAIDELEVRIPLVPLGPDPETGLWEFWHMLSGERPDRDAEGGLVETDQTGLVFRLRPGRILRWPRAEGPARTDRTGIVRGFEGPMLEAGRALTSGQWAHWSGSSWTGPLVEADPETLPARSGNEPVLLRPRLARGSLWMLGMGVPFSLRIEMEPLRIGRRSWRTLPVGKPDERDLNALKYSARERLNALLGESSPEEAWVESRLGFPGNAPQLILPALPASPWPRFAAWEILVSRGVDELRLVVADAPPGSPSPHAVSNDILEALFEQAASDVNSPLAEPSWRHAINASSIELVHEDATGNWEAILHAPGNELRNWLRSAIATEGQLGAQLILAGDPGLRSLDNALRSAWARAERWGGGVRVSLTGDSGPEALEVAWSDLARVASTWIDSVAELWEQRIAGGLRPLPGSGFRDRALGLLRAHILGGHLEEAALAKARMESWYALWSEENEVLTDSTLSFSNNEILTTVELSIPSPALIIDSMIEALTPPPDDTLEKELRRAAIELFVADGWGLRDIRDREWSLVDPEALIELYYFPPESWFND